MMVRAMKRLLLAAICLAGLAGAFGGESGSAPLAAAAPVALGDPAKGREVYDKWCTACHGRGPGHPGTQSLAIKYRGSDVPAALEDRTDLAPAVTAYFVRNGFALMSPFRKTEISDAQLRNLEAYLAGRK
jgi:(+)-pinoresinol hydroxylase